MELDSKPPAEIVIERPTGPRITISEPLSLGQFVAAKASKASKSVVSAAVVGASAGLAFLTRHKFASGLGASTITAIVTHLIGASMMMGMVGDKAPSGGGGSVTLDAIAGGAHFSQLASGTSGNYTLQTVGTGNALVVTIASTATITGLSLTWDSGGTNQAMTQIGTTATDGTAKQLYTFGLLNPTAGNKTLALSWTNTSILYVTSASWNGVNSTFGTAFTGSNNSGTGTTGTITVGSGTGHFVQAQQMETSGVPNITGTSATTIYTVSTNDSCGANYAAGPNVTATATYSSSTTWLASAVDISP